MKPVFDYVRVGYGCPDLSIWGVNDNNFYNRLHIPLSGRAMITVNTRTQIMEPGYAYLLPSHSDVSLSVEQGEIYEHVYIDFYLSPMSTSKHTRVINLEDNRVLEGFVQTLNLVLKNARNNCIVFSIASPPAYIKTFLDTILLYVLDVCDVRFLDDPIVTKAIDYIHEHYADDISNSDIANSIHVHTRHLVRLFKDNLKITPHKFLINVRISRAKALLGDGKSVKEACYMCGFSSPKIFGETFKRETGIMVSDYIAKVRGTKNKDGYIE